MIFLAVGTQFPFDRLVRALDTAIERGLVAPEAFGQIGKTSYLPRHFPYERFLSHGEFMSRLRHSSAVVSHAGVGVILGCVELAKPLLVMPRKSSLGEHVNDHQETTAARFLEAGRLMVANDPSDLFDQIPHLIGFCPNPGASGTLPLVATIGEHLVKLARANEGSNAG